MNQVPEEAKNNTPHPTLWRDDMCPRIMDLLQAEQ